MRITEVVGQWPFPTKIIQPDTLLYHGTKSAGEFALPDAPAWFAFSQEVAEKWIDWSSSPATGRTFGPPRVIVARVVKPIELADTRSARNWEHFCKALLGNPEPGNYEIANAAIKARVPGWFGHSEVMLTTPKRYLRPEPTP